MYNKELNDRATEQFKEAVAGKRVLLVGNAASLFSSEDHGELIDSYDFVLRFGKGYPYKRFADYLGTKTDAWFFGPGRAGMLDHFRATPWKIYTPSQLKIYDDKSDECLIPKSMLNGEFQIYRDFFMTGTSKNLVALNRLVNGDLADTARLSQGIQCIDWMYNVVGSYKSLTLIGFDFFEQEFTYSYDNARNPQIPREHPTTSWHCPLVSKHYDTNPHAFSAGDSGSNEKQYILSLFGIEHIKMPPLDLDKMQEVLNAFRGESSTIKR